MPYPYIDTPRTEADGNATFLTNGGLRSALRPNLSVLDSAENSFQIPSKDEDIIRSIEKRRNGDMSTPRAGASKSTRNGGMTDRRTSLGAKGEFTPLMRSATRNNYLRSAVRASGGGYKTPAHLRDGYRSNGNTPGLPPMDMTEIYEEGSMAPEDPTPLPQMVSSSPQSTPLPTASQRNGVLENGKNGLSLKEQENVGLFTSSSWRNALICARQLTSWTKKTLD